MTDKITGTVYRVFRKDWPANARNPKGNTTYSLKIEGDPRYYRTNNPWHGIAEPGNFVQFDAKPKDETSASIEGPVVKIDAPAAATVSVATPAGGTASGGYGSRDNSIVYQSSRKDALVYLDLIQETGAVKLPEKAALKLAALDALLDKYTADFFADVGSLGAVSRASGEAKTGETAAPEDEE